MSAIARIFRSCMIVSALVVVGIARPAVAQVDMNGPWTAQTFFGLYQFGCDMTFTQVGTSLGIAATCGVIGTVSASGTINPATGDFSASGTAGSECPVIQFTIANASLDNRTFFAGFVCTGGPNGFFQGALSGFRCGNGVVDAVSGEQCDTALTQCCTAVNCQYVPAGAFCSDGNQCTNDACDAAGTCVSSNRTGACDDDNQCTTPDECSAGVCIGTALPDGSACTDFENCTTDSCQGGVCDSTSVPDGSACDDGYDCQVGETCLGGVCQIGADIVCGPCERCDEGTGCYAEYNAGHSTENAITSDILLKKTSTDLAKWKWTSTGPMESSEFGDPTTTTGYEFCVFDPFTEDPETGAGRLLFGATVAAGSNWKLKSNGYSFTSADKKLRVRLKAGELQGKILVRAKGPTHSVQYLPPGSFVYAQIRTLPGVTPAVAFEADFDQPSTSTPTKFKAYTPFP